MKKRFLAMLLCLSVLLMACACAAETEPPIASHPEHQESSPQFTLSEVNAESSAPQDPAAPSETAPAESEPEETISMEESEISLEPIQPIEPIKPEEKETTLELIYDIPLNDARSPILLQYYEDPTQAEIVIPHSYTMDLNGDIYCILNDALCKLGSEEGFRLRDRNDVDRLVSSMAVYDEIIYVTYTDIEKNSGSISAFDITGKVLSSTMLPAARSMEFFNVYLSSKGTPNVLIQNDIYSLEGHKIGAFYEPDASKTSDYGVDVGNFSYPMTYRPLVLSNLGNVLTVRETQTKWFGTSAEGRHSVSEEIFYQYDNAGNLISKFKMTEVYCDQELPCEIAIGEAVCQKTALETVAIGKTVFENVFDASVFAGADGELYAILVYTDGTKIYRINPGYSDVEMTDLASIGDPKSECNICQEAEGGSSSASALSVTGNAQTQSTEIIVPAHPPFSREYVLDRANDMRLVKWTLLQGHLVTRYRTVEENGVDVTYSSIIPHYISQAAVGDELTGIPYCHGGLNGYDNISATDYRYRRFDEVVALEHSSGNWYTAGNIRHKGLFRYTIGLDCSGFVGSAYGHTQKLGVSDAAKYGHEISDYSQLQRMDMLVYTPSDGRHVMLFYAYNATTKEITVIDCTGATLSETQLANGRTQPANNVEMRILAENEYRKYTLRSTFYALATTATHHTYSCSHVDDEGNQCTPAVTEEHDWEVPDASKPCDRYCKVCNYSDTSLHTFTYLATSATSHTRTCTVCGYSDTVDHTFTYTSISGTQHTKTCTECGYSVTESHGGPCIAISATQHVNPCMACGYSSTANHTFSYTYSSGGHVATCTGCGYSVTAMHSLTAAGYNLLQHTRACSCGYSVTEAHTLHYHYDADGHWQECSVCSFETASLAHNFVDSECTVCGCPEFIIMDIIAIPEEDEPLPVPEDQKATL